MSTTLDFTLLGAGIPFKGNGKTVSGKLKIEQVVLDWLLSAADRNSSKINFVGGYNLDVVVEKYPGLNYFLNESWETTSATGSFLKSVMSSSGASMVSYVDVIYREEVLKKLAANDAPITVVVDSNWRSRFSSRGDADLSGSEKVIVSGSSVRMLGQGVSVDDATAEFIGLCKFSADVMKFVQKMSDELRDALSNVPFSDFLETLRLSGFDIHAIEINGEWAELNDPRDIGQFILGTKAETLMRFQNMLKNSVVLDQVQFRVEEWRENQSAIIKEISAQFCGGPIIIRSSALTEDSFETAAAGVYESRGDVDSGNAEEIVAAIEFVISSYDCGDGNDQVMVQPMLKEVAAAGVVFTRLLSSGGPYYTVNYDDESRSTDSITGGIARTSKTFKVSREIEDRTRLPEPLKTIIEAVSEIEGLLGIDSLDVEFAIGSDGVFYLFQVRPLITSNNDRGDLDQLVLLEIENAKKNFAKLTEPPHQILGEKCVFGSMPDWNPAEIIGSNPGRLAVDLYSNLILDDVWARQRAEYGYRDVRPHKLMRTFCGQPYVDVRASFNSFIPAEVPDSIAFRLIEAHLKRLADNPEAHDKVEFDVVPTCFDLNFRRWQEILTEDGFSNDEILVYENALRSLTAKAVWQRHGADVHLRLLEERFAKVKSSEMAPLRQALLLLDDAKEFGTLPFAHLARDGFIAVTLLKSGIASGVLTPSAVADFMRGLNSVTKQLTTEALNVKKGDLSADEFVDKYGHLRPDTYNIASPCYKQKQDMILEIIAGATESPAPSDKSSAWNDQKGDFLEALLDEGIGKDACQLERFLVAAIEGREYAKFIFSRNLSEALERLAEFGCSLGFDRHEMANIPIEFFRQLDVDGDEQGFIVGVRHWLDAKAEQLEARKMVVLPELLFSKDDFDFFIQLPGGGNFIGEGKVSAKCVSYRSDLSTSAYQGKLVLIESADPGYDWLFGAGIVGLITKYGGANSHMAIRAAEFGLPAVIGLGEARFNELSIANLIHLDCQGKTIRRIG